MRVKPPFAQPTNLSGTNLDVGDAQRVSDKDVANQHRRGDWISASACLSVASSRAPSHIEKRREPEGQAVGCPFFLVRLFLGIHKFVGNEFGHRRCPEGKSHGCDESN